MAISQSRIQQAVNIRRELEYERSRTQTMKIAAYACASAKNCKELMRCFMSDEYRIAQRAAWSLSWVAKKKPEMIRPFIKDLVTRMQCTDVHNGVIRTSVQILETQDIPEELHGEVMNTCFGFIENPLTPVAVKAFALTTLFNLSKKYPDIQSELKLIIEEKWDTETAAFRSRGKKILLAYSKKQLQQKSV